MESISLPNTLAHIGAYAFDGCTSLKNITLPENLTDISSCLFGGCESLAYVTIGKNVKTIGYNAFGGCESLAVVFFTGTEAQWNAIRTYTSMASGETTTTKYIGNATVTYI